MCSEAYVPCGYGVNDLFIFYLFIIFKKVLHDESGPGNDFVQHSGMDKGTYRPFQNKGKRAALNP